MELATHPAKLALLRHKLESSRLTCPLFDTQRWVVNVERAFKAMIGRYEAGLLPCSMAVTEEDREDNDCGDNQFCYSGCVPVGDQPHLHKCDLDGVDIADDPFCTEGGGHAAAYASPGASDTIRTGSHWCTCPCVAQWPRTWFDSARTVPYRPVDTMTMKRNNKAATASAAIAGNDMPLDQEQDADDDADGDVGLLSLDTDGGTSGAASTTQHEVETGPVGEVEEEEAAESIISSYLASHPQPELRVVQLDQAMQISVPQLTPLHFPSSASSSTLPAVAVAAGPAQAIGYGTQAGTAASFGVSLAPVPAVTATPRTITGHLIGRPPVLVRSLPTASHAELQTMGAQVYQQSLQLQAQAMVHAQKQLQLQIAVQQQQQTMVLMQAQVLQVQHAMAAHHQQSYHQQHPQVTDPAALQLQYQLHWMGLGMQQQQQRLPLQVGFHVPVQSQQPQQIFIQPTLQQPMHHHVPVSTGQPYEQQQQKQQVPWGMPILQTAAAGGGAVPAGQPRQVFVQPAQLSQPIHLSQLHQQGQGQPLQPQAHLAHQKHHQSSHQQPSHQHLHHSGHRRRRSSMFTLSSTGAASSSGATGAGVSPSDFVYDQGYAAAGGGGGVNGRGLHYPHHQSSLITPPQTPQVHAGRQPGYHQQQPPQELNRLQCPLPTLQSPGYSGLQQQQHQVQYANGFGFAQIQPAGQPLPPVALPPWHGQPPPPQQQVPPQPQQQPPPHRPRALAMPAVFRYREQRQRLQGQQPQQQQQQ